MASEHENFEAVITARDETGPTLEKAKEHVNKFAHEAEQAGHHVQRIHHPKMWGELAEHVEVTREHFHGLRESVGELGEGLAELVPAIGAFTAAWGMEQLAETAEQTAERFGEMSHEAQKLGTTVEHLHDLQSMATLTDTSVEGLDKALGKMNITMGEVIGGGNKEAASLFAHLRIDPRQFHDATDALVTFGDVFEKTSKVKGGVEIEARMANTLFGKGGKELIPLLNHGSEWIKEHLEEAHKHNFTPDEEQFKSLEAYNESMKGLKLSVQSFRDEVGAKLTPAFGPVIKAMDEWVQKNKDWTATAVTADIKILSDNLSAVDWRAIGGDMKFVGDKINWVVENTTGWKHLLEGMALYWTASKLFAIFGKPVEDALKLSGSLMTLGGKITELAAKWDLVAKSAGAAAKAEAVAAEVPAVSAAERGAAAGAVAVPVAAHAAKPAASAGVAATEVAAAAAGGGLLARAGAARRMVAGALLSPELLTGYLVHEADSDDKAGQWIDRHVPGAAWVDDWFARHTGGAVGRAFPVDTVAAADRLSLAPAASFETVRLGSLGLEPPPELPRAPGSEFALPKPDPARVDGDIRVQVDMSGVPRGARVDTQVAGSPLLSARVNTGIAWDDDGWRR